MDSVTTLTIEDMWKIIFTMGEQLYTLTEDNKFFQKEKQEQKEKEWKDIHSYFTPKQERIHPFIQTWWETYDDCVNRRAEWKIKYSKGDDWVELHEEMEIRLDNIKDEKLSAVETNCEICGDYMTDVKDEEEDGGHEEELHNICDKCCDDDTVLY